MWSGRTSSRVVGAGNSGGSVSGPKTRGLGLPCFLGLAHVWGTSWKGNRVVRQITAKSRLARAVKTVYQWCKSNRHQPLSDQQTYLTQAIRGHCAYYGLTGNGKSVALFRHEVARSWRKALSRRSRTRRVNWQHMSVLVSRFPLPQAKVTRSIYAS